jgi:alpha-L-rhamnosidase
MDRKMKYTIYFSRLIFISLVLLISCQKREYLPLQVSNLRTEMLVNPEGIDAMKPKLTWELSGDHRGIIQTDYRILVASSPDKLEANEGDLWDSGEVESDKSILVSYEGKPLKSRMRCYWKVKVWSENGESDWSEPARWSMGFLYEQDWQGRWIGFDRAFPWDNEGMFSRLSARYFRKEFTTSKEISHATVYIIGLGLYELYINGQKIGNQVLAPAPTDYNKNVKYNVFDVTGNVQTGNNAVGVVLGNGRYYTMRHNYKPYKIKDFGYPKLLLQLEVEYADGTKKVISTDNSWKGTADGPIRSNNEYDGEDYDARKEMPGWTYAGFNDSNWEAVEYVQEPGGDLEAQMNENMKVMGSVNPVSINLIKPDTYIMDMGQNMTGWIKMKLKGEKGRLVKLRFAEILKENGELFTDNLRDAKVTDIYILKGGEEEVWEPSFVYHGFRYVEISGYPGKPTTDDFEGKVVYDNIETTGTFETSSSVTNQIFRNACWGISGNYKGMPVDCPQRNERQPWLGDRAVGSHGESFIFDNARLYIKWLDDIRNTQKADGSICDVAPAYLKYYSDNMTWPGTYLLITDMLYNQFGDKAVIVKHYSSMKKWMEYMRNNYMTEKFIVTKDSYGDWCVPPETIEAGRGKSADVKHPSSLISTAYYYHLLQLMERFAKLTGNDADISGYTVLADSMKAGFNNHFYNPESSSYGDNKLTDNLLPLSFGMVPDGQTEKVVKNIVNIIEETNNGHLSCGVVGIQWLMRGLTENGRADLAYKIATSTTYPGWGYMIENGATTIWELWNGNTAAPNMNSYNHVMLLGDLIVWYYENLAGIKSNPEKPGFKEIIMVPEIIDGLDFVNASCHSMHGLIKSEWRKEANNFFWDITVPGNSKAMVFIPANAKSDVTENGEKATKADGIKFLRMEQGRAVFEIGSGEYHFKSKLRKG